MWTRFVDRKRITHPGSGETIRANERLGFGPLEPGKRCSAKVVGLEPFSHGPPRVYGVHQAERIHFPCDDDKE